MKKYENIFKQSLTALLLLISCNALTQPTSYSPQDLTAAATRWLQHQLPQTSQLNIDVTALDNRIGDKTCTEPLQFSLSQPVTQRQNTVKIRCSANNNWQLYLPVRIDETVQAIILQQNIATGSMITADMLVSEQRQRRFIRGNLVSDPAAVIGARAKRALSIGQVVTLQDLCLVCKGDVVTITANDNGLNVAATGIAQADGTLGDTIPVTNRQSGRDVSAQVIAVSQVKVKF